MIEALRFALAAWRGVRAVHVASALLLGTGAFTVMTAPYWKENVEQENWEIMLRGLLVHVMIAACLVLAVTIADRAHDRGAGGRAAYVCAIVAGSAVGVTLDWLIQDFVWHTFTASVDPGDARIPMLVWPLWRMTEWMMVGGFAVFLHAERREMRAMTKRLRAAELNRLAKSRAMVEARLKVLQARIEPQFLFDTLAEVRELYRHDAVPASIVRASRMFDELIAYLRAAIPQMRASSSTVGHELTLVRTHLAFVRPRVARGFEFSVEEPSDLDEAPMPPMMLLPLVEHMVRAARSGFGPTMLRVRCERAGRCVGVCVDAEGAGMATEVAAPDLVAIRARLRTIYGDDARLVIDATPSRRLRVQLQWPVARSHDMATMIHTAL
jgi:hypothetical protein